VSESVKTSAYFESERRSSASSCVREWLARAGELMAPSLLTGQSGKPERRASILTRFSAVALVPIGTAILSPGIMAQEVQRSVIVNASISEASTSPSKPARQDQMNLDYSIDGGVPVAIGPEFFSSDTHEATRTAIGVIKLGPGTHTIQPVISSVTGSGVTVEIRCLTVEGQTK
jgi:hypothetical protein